jgi:hypothetical protein
LLFYRKEIVKTSLPKKRISRYARKDKVMRVCLATARQDRVGRSHRAPIYCCPKRNPRALIPSVHLMLFEGIPLSLCCNLYFSAYNYLKKRAKDIEIIEIKLEKELQEIKALLLQLLKHYEHSESKTSYSSYSLFLFFLYTVLMFIKGLFFLCGKRARLYFFEAQEYII